VSSILNDSYSRINVDGTINSNSKLFTTLQILNAAANEEKSKTYDEYD